MNKNTKLSEEEFNNMLEDFMKKVKTWKKNKIQNRKKNYLIKYRSINHDKLKLQRKKYCEVHRKEINAYFNNRAKTKPYLNIRSRISSTLRRDLSRFLKTNKEFNTMNYVGCNVSFLKKHIESQFHDGMSWDNYHFWHIDHRIPCNYFLNQPNPDFKLFYNWRNLQPMWATENCRKGKRLPPNHEELLANLRKEVYGESNEEVKV